MRALQKAHIKVYGLRCSQIRPRRVILSFSGVKVRSSNGEVQQSGDVVTIMISESVKAIPPDLFYKTVEGKLDVWLEIEPFDSLAELEFPVFTNEG